MTIAWVTREMWRAARVSGTENKVPARPAGIVVHWSATAAERGSHALCMSQVRGIQRYHQQGKGWADIAYNFLICSHGNVFVGRGTSAGSAANGTTSANTHWWAVCFLQGPHDAVSPSAGTAFVNLRTYLAQRGCGAAVEPHHKFITTECPGAILSSWLRLRFKPVG